MTQVSSQVRVAGTGELFLAPLGTVLPTSAAGELDPAFVGYGYTDDNGVVLSKSIKRDGVPAWQSLTPVRYITTEQDFTVAATFLQSNAATLKAWLNSGDFAPDGNTENPGYRADISVDPITLQYALVLDWDDSGITSRLIIPKVEITDTGDVSLARKATGFAITFGALAPDTGNILASWTTTDPAFAAATPAA
jgi:hypothetical protein